MKYTNSKIIKNAMDGYKWSCYSELSEVYGRYSRAKEFAMFQCESLMEMLNGYDMRIISHNTFQFSVGFRFMKDGKEMFAYITRDQSRYTEWC